MSTVSGITFSIASLTPGAHPLAANWVFYAICGLLQLGVCFALCSALEKRWPLMQWERRNPIGADLTYAIVVRLFLFPAIVCVEYPLLHELLTNLLARSGIVYLGLSGLTNIPRVGWTLCLVTTFIVLDCADYWKHRLSHKYAWWYGVHSLHHAEEQLTFLSDERSHLVEDAITFATLIVAALATGVPPMAFPFSILGMRTIATVAHSNTRIEYGSILGRVFVSPQFHRAHHARHRIRKGSLNIGTALACWDIIFGTADFAARVTETGDAGASPALVSGGWFEQQIAGWNRMIDLSRKMRVSDEKR